MIELKNVSKWYGDFQVLTDCSTKIDKGEVVVVCGPSGSGKSTVANALEVSLNSMNHHTYILDGDNTRLGLNKGLGFSEEDRNENLRRVAELMINAS